MKRRSQRKLEKDKLVLRACLGRSLVHPNALTRAGVTPPGSSLSTNAAASAAASAAAVSLSQMAQVPPEHVFSASPSITATLDADNSGDISAQTPDVDSNADLSGVETSPQSTIFDETDDAAPTSVTLRELRADSDTKTSASTLELQVPVQTRTKERAKSSFTKPQVKSSESSLKESKPQKVQRTAKQRIVRSVDVATADDSLEWIASLRGLQNNLERGVIRNARSLDSKNAATGYAIQIEWLGTLVAQNQDAPHASRVVSKDASYESVRWTWQQRKSVEPNDDCRDHDRSDPNNYASTTSSTTNPGPSTMDNQMTLPYIPLPCNGAIAVLCSISIHDQSGATNEASLQHRQDFVLHTVTQRGWPTSVAHDGSSSAEADSSLKVLECIPLPAKPVATRSVPAPRVSLTFHLALASSLVFSLTHDDTASPSKRDTRQAQCAVLLPHLQVTNLPMYVPLSASSDSATLAYRADIVAAVIASF